MWDRVAAIRCEGCGQIGTVAAELLGRDDIKIKHSIQQGGCGATMKPPAE